MARHRNNPNMAFWKMIKEGYDHFEITHQEPKVDFCEKKYVFDAVKAPNAAHDPVFEASAKCPAYVVPDELADATRQKDEQDQAEIAKLIAKGTPVAKLNTGIDGGMNQVFAAQVPGGNTGLSEGGEGQGLSLAGFHRVPGTIPPTVNPPHLPGADETAVAVAAAPQAAAPPAATAPETTRVASASPGGDGFFSGLARKVGLGGATADTTAATTPPPTSAPSKQKAAEAKHPDAAKPPAPKAPETKQAANHPPLKPSVADTSTDQQPGTATSTVVVSGAQPIVQANSFENRFSAVK